MDIVLIRHGESEANLINQENYSVFTGQWECSLTEKGIEQAKRLKDNSILKGVERYYVSDSLRAQETASYFAEKNEIVLDSRLRERSLGEFEGKYVRDIQDQEKYRQYFTNSALMSFRHDFKVKAPGGENYQDVCNRAESFLCEIRKLNFSKIAVISHMCTIRCILKLLQNFSEEETLKIKVPQCEPIILYGVFR
ncbi:MAG: histidine phosphatase family protein [Acetatifactor sp.]